MKLLDRDEPKELKVLALALVDTPAKGTSLLQLSDKAQLPVSRARMLLEKHTDYFVNVAGSGFYALNRFGPYKGDGQAILDSIDQEAQAAASRRKIAVALFFIAFVLFVLAK